MSVYRRAPQTPPSSRQSPSLSVRRRAALSPAMVGSSEPYHAVAFVLYIVKCLLLYYSGASLIQTPLGQKKVS